jgi:hypothetical protein
MRLVLVVTLVVALLYQANCSNQQLRKNVIKSLNGLLSLLDSRVEMLPLDTVYTLRGIQGMLSPINGVHEQMISHKARDIARRAIPIQKAKHYDYYKQFRPLIAHGDDFVVEVGLSLPKVRRNKSKQFAAWNETENDLCMEQAIRCTATPSCIDMETHFSATGYRLTHQILYFNALLKCNNLTDQQADLFRNNTAQMVSNMISEFKKLKSFDDLYAERLLIATITGYNTEIVTDAVVKQLLSLVIKKPTGICWGDEFENRIKSFEELVDYDSGDNCAFHTSGLVGYALAGYLRYH